MESLTASVLEVSPERIVNRSQSLPTLLEVRLSIQLRKLSQIFLFRHHWRRDLCHPLGSAHLDDLRQGNQGEEAREARTW